MALPLGLNQDWLQHAVETKFQETLPGDLVSVDVEPLNVMGGHFTSIVKKIKMMFKNKIGRKREVMLVVKLSRSFEVDSKEMESLTDNKTEIEIYNNVLKQMEILMMEFDDKRDVMWPKLYGNIPYSVLLLEDLEANRYLIRPRTNWLDEEHALLVLRSLGRYHAMSKILLKRKMIGEEYRNAYVFGKKNGHQENCLQGSLHLLSKIMMQKVGRWKSVESSEHWGKLWNQQKPLICDRMESIYLACDKRFEVLNHGDFRSSNMMFKTMEYTDRPTEIKFYDFQLPHINSFMWDIVYFLTLSVDPTYRRQHRDRLLEAYQLSLSDNLKFFGWEDYIPTTEDVKNESNRLIYAEFVFMSCIAPVIVATRENAFQIDKVATHPPEEAFNELIYGDDHFVNAIIGDFKRVVELKII